MFVHVNPRHFDLKTPMDRTFPVRFWRENLKKSKIFFATMWRQRFFDKGPFYSALVGFRRDGGGQGRR